MIYLNCGNLWDMEFLDTIANWNEEFKDTIQVKALFGSVAGLTPTARSVDRLPFLSTTDTIKYVDRATSYGIAIRYTLNQSCIGAVQDFKHKWESSLKRNIQSLHDVGVREWTITSPLLVELVRELLPNDFIEVSTIAEVATPKDAIRWQCIGANGINLSTNINRDFDLIRTIVDTGTDVSLLANEACLYNCAWRRDCYNLSSHDSWRGVNFFKFYPFERCNELRMVNPAEWLISRMILPQWMKKYQLLTGVDWFKVTCRTHPKEVALPIIRAYMEQNYTGNLLNLWPTIAALGGTREPQKETYISCEDLVRNNFLDRFIESGHLCSTIKCDVECVHCHNAYRDSKR